VRNSTSARGCARVREGARVRKGAQGCARCVVVDYEIQAYALCVGATLNN
jgi:hypothetical protein